MRYKRDDVEKYLDLSPTEFASSLRTRMTPAESLMWDRLRGCKLGVRFNHQKPLRGGRYILDFYCSAAQLAVEIDGPYHRDRVAKDRIRDNVLLSAGISTLHLTNQEVLSDIESCIARVLREVEYRLSSQPETKESVSTAMSMRSIGSGVSTRMAPTRFQVATPYSPVFVDRARELEGRWKKRSRMWSFPRRNYAKVAKTINEIFGTSLPVHGADNAPA